MHNIYCAACISYNWSTFIRYIKYNSHHHQQPYYQQIFASKAKIILWYTLAVNPSEHAQPSKHYLSHTYKCNHHQSFMIHPVHGKIHNKVYLKLEHAQPSNVDISLTKLQPSSTALDDIRIKSYTWVIFNILLLMSLVCTRIERETD